jgi:hypothetical protein
MCVCVCVCVLYVLPSRRGSGFGGSTSARTHSSECTPSTTHIYRMADFPMCVCVCVCVFDVHVYSIDRIADFPV